MKLGSPDQTLGVVGAGQLGRMLGEAAAPQGVEVVVLDPTPRAPASPVVRSQIEAEFDDKEALRELAGRSDYLTYEIELADPDLLETVGDEAGVPVHPTPETLRVIEDKLRQNDHFRDAGVPLPRYRRVDSLEELRSALDELGFPAMLKARRGGYDGRGNVPIKEPGEVKDAFAAVGGDVLVEEFINYDRELSVIGCVGSDERRTYPVTETIHREEILRETVTPARTSQEVRERARGVALDALNALDGRGVYGIELFKREGEVLLNEVAPRPHNSGHWTIEGARTSQFEQHVRAVTGRPLGSTELRSPTVSANILGDVDEPRRTVLSGVETVLTESHASLHWYGKREVRPLRKMGHYTLTGDDEGRDGLLRRAREIHEELTFRSS